MRSLNKKYGNSPEGKRITPVYPNHEKDKYPRNAPIDFYKQGAGDLNYDPELGWVQPNSTLDGEPLASSDYTMSVDEKSSTNFLRKSNGLPGGRM